MQLRKNDGKIDKAKLRSGSMPNIRKGTRPFRVGGRRFLFAFRYLEITFIRFVLLSRQGRP